MVRDLDPDGDARALAVLGNEGWSDYDSAMAYGDFDVAINGGNPVPTDQTRYLSGFGTHVQQTISTAETRYLHGDLIRSTNLTTDDSGSAVASVAYTAFGEPIGDASLLETRYQYAGGWGYESDLLVLQGAPGTIPITLQHVGHRWYDPALGRFIQRDPIGIWGGLNVYEYLLSYPTIAVDPNGQGWVKWCIKGLGAGIIALLCYHACLEEGEHAGEKFVTRNIGLPAAIKMDIVKKDIPVGGRGQLDDPGGNITRCIYLRVSETRISVMCTIEGKPEQFYIDD